MKGVLMLSFKTYYDMRSARKARFSKNYNTRQAVEISKTLNGRIKLFEDYYAGWYLIPLKRGLREGTALIAAIVLFSLCDVMEQFKRGEATTNATTSEFVRSALANIYHDTLKNMSEEVKERYIKELYDVLRNGLHHDLGSRNIHIIVSNDIPLMIREGDGHIAEIFFDVGYFLNAIEGEFAAYIKMLQNDTNIEEGGKFNQVFSKIFTLEDLGNQSLS